MIREPVSRANGHTQPSYPTVLLRPGSGRRLRHGHPWIYSNELVELPKEPEPGALVTVKRADGSCVGVGTFNPHSLIAVRLLANRREIIDESFVVSRLQAALRYREQIYPGRDAYRLVNGEGDGLPGLVIDRYGETFVIASHTAGMDRLLPLVSQALRELFSVKAIVLRNDSEIRKLEGLSLLTQVLYGEVPGPTKLTENGMTFEVDVVRGQKTGWFFDQAENRSVFAAFAQGRDVLDAFCYVGSWAISAARAGARSVTAVDSSPRALELAARNLELNGVTGVELIQGNVFELLPAWCEEGKQWDLVVVDPPAFARVRRHIPAARRGYGELHRRVLHLLRSGGVLFSCSCSHHFGEAELLPSLARAAHNVHRRVRVLEVRGASRDHPVLPSTPETRYLTCVVAQVE